MSADQVGLPMSSHSLAFELAVREMRYFAGSVHLMLNKLPVWGTRKMQVG